PVLGNTLFPRQPEQGAFRVALVVLQRLGSQARGRVVQLAEIGSNRAVAGGDNLERLVQGLGDLPQGCRPVPPGLFGKFTPPRGERPRPLPPTFHPARGPAPSAVLS